MAKKKSSRILAEVAEAAQDLYAAGVIDLESMREFDALCLPPVPHYKPEDIKRIRKTNRASQGVFAIHLNVSKPTVAAWEQGLKSPSGAALKLLDLVERNGLKSLA